MIDFSILEKKRRRKFHSIGTLKANIIIFVIYQPKYSLVQAKPSGLCKQPENPTEIQGEAVAIQRGNCTLFTKGLIAKKAGAKEVIIVSNDTLVSVQ